MVGTHTTGHAESVRITFDPRRISYGQMLQIHFSVAHNPTELNRQGPDVGSQYRSAIFPTNPEQMRIAEAYIVQLNQAHVFDGAIVTKTEPGRDFYPAEDYHQDFLTRNPNYPYIVVNDLPKIEALKRLFPTFIARRLCLWPRQRHGTDSLGGGGPSIELDGPFERVNVVMGDTAWTVNQGGASGNTGNGVA
jgi:methionine-S-sulfoxide reductase